MNKKVSEAIAADLQPYQVYPISAKIEMTEKVNAGTGRHYQMSFSPNPFPSLKLQKADGESMEMPQVEALLQERVIALIGGLDANIALLQEHQYLGALSRPAAVVVLTPEVRSKLHAELLAAGFTLASKLGAPNGTEHFYRTVAQDGPALATALGL